MRAAIGLIAAIIAAPAVAAFPLEFKLPGELQSNQLETQTAEWVLLIFAGDANAELEVLSATDLKLHNDTKMHAVRIRYEENIATAPGPSNRTTGTIPGPSRLWGGFNGQPGSMLLSLDSVRFEAGRTQGTILGKPAGETFEAFGQPSDEFRDLYDNARAPGGHDVVTALAPQPEGLVEFSLIANTTSISFYNAALECSTKQCPSGGGPSMTSAEPIPRYSVAHEQHSYETLEGDMQVNVQGSFSYAVLGSTKLSLALFGSARLPLASAGSVDCATCILPDNETLWVEGEVILDGLTLTGQGTVGGSLDGNVQQARIDEMPVDPSDLLRGGGVLVAGTTAAALAIAGVKYLFGWLFTRRSEEDLLENPRRRQIYEYVIANPGAHFREALRGASVPAGAGRHHVNRMVAAGLLAVRRQGTSMLLFENHGRYDANWQNVVAARDDCNRRILDWLSVHPDSTQKTILDAFQIELGWNRSTTQKRLDRLQELGVVVARSHGRYKLYNLETVQTVV
jgi:predicted transcriptional regulator